LAEVLINYDCGIRRWSNTLQLLLPIFNKWILLWYYDLNW